MKNPRISCDFSNYSVCLIDRNAQIDMIPYDVFVIVYRCLIVDFMCLYLSILLYFTTIRFSLGFEATSWRNNLKVKVNSKHHRFLSIFKYNWVYAVFNRIRVVQTSVLCVVICVINNLFTIVLCFLFRFTVPDYLWFLLTFLRQEISKGNKIIKLFIDWPWLVM